MKKKSILSGALCLSMLCCSAYAINTYVDVSVENDDAYYEIREDAAILSDSRLASVTAVTSETPSAETAAESAVEITSDAETITLAEVIADEGAVEMPVAVTPYWTGERATISALPVDGLMEFQTEIGSTLSVKISDKTICIDNQQAIPVNISDLKPGDEVYLYLSPPTDSAPTAAVVVTNLGDDSIAHLHMAELITAASDLTSVLCDHGGIIVTATAETEFIPYATRQIVTAQDLRVNAPFLAWYDVVAESYPGQATATRIVILPSDTADETPTVVNSETPATMDEVKAVKVGDTQIVAKQVEGRIHVPARAVSEALGLTVDWYKEYGIAYVSIYGEPGSVAMAIGEDKYTFLPSTLDMESASKGLGTVPYYAPYQDSEATTWIDAEAFEMMGFRLTSESGILSIT